MKKELEKLHAETKPWLFHKVFGEYLKTLSDNPVETPKEEKKKVYRSNKQNRALHKYLADLSAALNEAGVGTKVFLEKLSFYDDIPLTPELLKLVWKTKQEKMFQHESTTQLTTSEINRLYDVVNKFTSQEFGVSEAFPSMESILIKSESEQGYKYPDYDPDKHKPKI